MTGDAFIGALEARRDEIRGRLAAAASAGDAERDALKQEIIALFRTTDSALERLGELKEEIRSLVEAYKALAPARPAAGASVRIDHIGASTYVERGWSAISVGDTRRAVAALERALELSPDNPDAEVLLGWAWVLDERHDDALALFQKVLARHPDHALARAKLGYVCLQKRIFGEAIEHLSGVIRSDGDRKATLYATYYLGLVYLEREMHADARSFLHRALELGPNLIEAYWHLGRSHLLEGDETAARDAWRKGAETNRFNPWGERCAEALRRAEAGEAPLAG
jgi:tetratricopeptide (TPR) repeat protein